MNYHHNHRATYLTYLHMDHESDIRVISFLLYYVHDMEDYMYALFP